MRQAVKFGVDAGAVKALAVVLDDRLPVRVDLVDNLGSAIQFAEPVMRELLGELADVFRRGGRLT